ncbi:FkbM family methyltransferase [Chitinophaga rhizophila]|uniref:FkbM family methyltransferase n=1 Tax=Chitinophaga rhizophila TaxID=2866212 RepID=A0ABS7GAP2_9BACT|nr:FkbM family methyltransferase [Chitinophaga rhizophila]MBW8683879.1 FkbM family methyltransferase [Chitinophaga rhizophila]
MTKKRRPNEFTFLQELRLKNLPRNKMHSFDFRNGKIWFTHHKEFRHSYQELIVDEIYKFRTDNETPFIIDCGANIGMSVLYFKWLYPKAKVLAFEPDDANLVYLRKNIEGYGLTDVTVRTEALWTHDGTISFEADGTQGSKIAGGESTEKQLVTIPCVRLATMLNQKVDFLKMDIEGAEYEILKDCKDQLKNVEYAFVEYHGDILESNHLTEILQILNDAGFNYYIKIASDNVANPLLKEKQNNTFDQQLNIFCHRGQAVK